MPYDAKAVANYLLELAENDGKPISPLKLQKLVYFAHGWHLAIKGEPLLTDCVEAWEWGPVIPDPYHEFKDFGNGSINRRATQWLMRQGKIRVTQPTIDSCDDAEANESTKALLKKIWAVYGRFTAIQLSNMTHEDGSPWDRTRQKYGARKNADIQDEWIKEDFLMKARANESTAR